MLPTKVCCSIPGTNGLYILWIFLLPKIFSMLVKDSHNLLANSSSYLKNLICTILSIFSTHTILAAAGFELLTIRMRDERLESTATANLFSNNQIS